MIDDSLVIQIGAAIKNEFQFEPPDLLSSAFSPQCGEEPWPSGTGRVISRIGFQHRGGVGW
jgi:hypothetical protein